MGSYESGPIMFSFFSVIVLKLIIFTYSLKHGQVSDKIEAIHVSLKLRLHFLFFSINDSI